MQVVFTPTVAPVSEMLPEPAAAVGVPAQVFASPLGVATRRFAGKASVKATPVRAAVLADGFVIVKVSVVVPFTATPDAPNARLIVGGASTVKFAVLLVVPAPPSVEVTFPVVLLTDPAVVPVTFTLKLHEPAAASVPLDRLTDEEPATAESVPVPHEPVRPFGVDTARPVGSESLKPTPLRVFVAFGFVTVKLSDVEPLSETLDAPNALLTVGGARTVRVAVLLTAPVPLWVEETAPVVFSLAPAVVPVTFTLSVQLLLIGSVPPARVMLPEAAVAVGVPPQVFANPFGVAITRPVGRASLKATPVRATGLVAGLVIVKVNVAFPLLRGIVGTLNALLMVGGAAPLSIAVLLTAPVPPFVELTAPVVLGKVPAVVGVTFTVRVQFVETPTVPPVSETVPAPAVAVGVPLHVFANPFGVAINRPVGRVSLKATPVRPTVLAAGFVIVKVSVVVAFTATPLAPKALLIVGGATTARLAVLLAEPVPPSAEVTFPVVLLSAPAVVPVTLTLKLQVPPDASVPLDRFTEEVPATAEMVPVPHEPVRPLGVDTAMPVGSESVKATPLRAFVAFGFVTVKLSDVEPLSETLDAPNALLIVGGATTVSVAVLLTAPAPLCVEEIAPVVFGFAPAEVPVTFTLIVQVPPGAADVPFARETVPEPAAAVTVPPHVSVTPGVAAIAKPAGKLSLNATPVSAAKLAAGLATVKVKVVLPLVSGIVAAPNALLIVGGPAAFRIAVLLATPVPPLLDLTVPAPFTVLEKLPAAVAVTFTLIVQVPPGAADVPFAKEIVPEPAAAVTVPLHVSVTPGVAATAKPAGKLSLKARPV